MGRGSRGEGGVEITQNIILLSTELDRHVRMTSGNKCAGKKRSRYWEGGAPWRDPGEGWSRNHSELHTLVYSAILACENDTRKQMCRFEEV